MLSQSYQLALLAKKSKQIFKILISSLLIRPQGTKGSQQIREKPKNSIFKVSDATKRSQSNWNQKNTQKVPKFIKKCQFLRGFWEIAALKPHGRIWNLKNRILWFLPDLQTPLGTLWAYQQQSEIKIGSICLSVKNSHFYLICQKIDTLSFLMSYCRYLQDI